jgi:hypothetical protein
MEIKRQYFFRRCFDLSSVFAFFTNGLERSSLASLARHCGVSKRLRPSCGPTQQGCRHVYIDVHRVRMSIVFSEFYDSWTWTAWAEDVTVLKSCIL